MLNNVHERGNRMTTEMGKYRKRNLYSVHKRAQ